ncbi:WD40 repeat-like protein [Leucogyrophana mollusca]|uniref:WD40 repeat-like protein n=1 Tax=Leucogyrophana mollusca TaxID=85980 RepID=A0ACB8BBJ7_9AGAM|nr:WD40 repeat-like protein [Leucogyrophana mollusca]
MSLPTAAESERPRYCTRILKGHRDNVWALAYTPDGRYIVSGSFGAAILILDVRTGETVGSPLTGHSDVIDSLVVTPGGKKLISGSRDGTVRVWDLQSRRVTHTLEALAPVPDSEPPPSEQSFVPPSISPDGRRVITISNNIISMREVETDKSVMEPIEFRTDSHVTTLVWSPDGKKFVVSGGGALRIWDSITGRLIAGPFKFEARFSPIVFSHDGHRVIWGGADGKIWIRDTREENRVLPPLVGHEDRVITLGLSPDGERIVSCSDDFTMYIWDATTGTRISDPLQCCTPNNFAFHHLAFSPDGKFVASSSDNHVKIWDMEAALAGYRASNQPKAGIGAPEARVPRLPARVVNRPSTSRRWPSELDYSPTERTGVSQQVLQSST